MTRPWEVKSSSSSLGHFGRDASNNDLIPRIPVGHRVAKSSLSIPESLGVMISGNSYIQHTGKQRRISRSSMKSK